MNKRQNQARLQKINNSASSKSLAASSMQEKQIPPQSKLQKMKQSMDSIKEEESTFDNGFKNNSFSYQQSLSQMPQLIQPQEFQQSHHPQNVQPINNNSLFQKNPFDPVEINKGICSSNTVNSQYSICSSSNNSNTIIPQCNNNNSQESLIAFSQELEWSESSKAALEEVSQLQQLFESDLLKQMEEYGNIQQIKNEKYDQVLELLQMRIEETVNKVLFAIKNLGSEPQIKAEWVRDLGNLQNLVNETRYCVEESKNKSIMGVNIIMSNSVNCINQQINIAKRSLSKSVRSQVKIVLPGMSKSLMTKKK